MGNNKSKYWVIVALNGIGHYMLLFQLTLEEATALLSEMESSEMEIDCETSELGDIKESVSEHENSPSQDLDTIDP